MLSDDRNGSGKKRTAEKSIEKLEAAVLQYKSDGSGKDTAVRKRDRKKLKKLKDHSFMDFLSCGSQDSIDTLVLSQEKPEKKNGILMVNHVSRPKPPT